MPNNLTIAKRGLIVVIVLLAFELCFVMLIAFALHDTRQKLATERHNVEVLAQISRMANLTQRMSTAIAKDLAPGLRGMITQGHEVEVFRSQLKQDFSSLERMIPQDKDQLEHLQNLITQILVLYDNERTLGYGANDPVDLARELSMMAMGHRVAQDYEQLLAHYKEVNASTPDQTAQSIARLKQLLIAGFVLNIIACLALALFFVRKVTSRLLRLAENIERFKEHQDLLPLMDDGDEIAELDHLFHEAADNWTQAKQSETALIEGAYDVICTINNEGTIVAVNGACHRQWGYSADSLLGAHFGKVVSDPDVAGMTTKLSALKNKSAYITFDAAINCSDGKVIETQWSCYWSAAENAAFCFVHDVSEMNSMENALRNSEEQVRTLIANMPVGLLVVGEDGSIKSANHKIEALVCGPAQSLIGDNVETLFQKDQPLPLDANQHRCNLTKTAGEPIVVEVSIEHLDKSQNSERLVVVEDVREQVRLEALKRDFVVLLRNHLRSMLQAVKDQLLGLITDSSGESKGRVERNIDRLLRLIDELIMVETISSSKLIGELKQEHLDRILVEARDALSDYAAKQRVSIDLDCGLQTISILGDGERLVQVVINLLSNAIKFSMAGQTVSVSVVSEGTDVTVSVSDSGRGIPRHMQESIFRPYTQASASDAQTGTGLGLPICKAIIEAHGGTLGVESREGQGSTFWFRLPAVAGEN